jgi:inner membrane protein
MDSLTQIVLGAGVAELMIGKKIGNKAMLIGAIAGTIPDLDVLLTMNSDDIIKNLMVHRSYSHSMFTHIVLALPLAWLTFKIFKQKISYMQWYWVWFMGLFTHALLDCCTTYGTQLFLPFTNYLVGLNNINIIDPLYTLPFMILLIVAMFYKKENPKRHKIAWAAMIISSLYMAGTFVSKYVAHQHFEQALQAQHIKYDHLSTSPAILNNILWSGMAYDDSTMYVSEYSHLQKRKDIPFMKVARNRTLLNNHPATKAINTLNWFAQGKEVIIPNGDTLNYVVAKWGRGDFKNDTNALKSFLFYYKIMPDGNGQYTVAEVTPQNQEWSFKQAFKDLWDRIFYW